MVNGATSRNTRTMTPPATLDGPFRPPASGGDPKQLVILLHGVGSDGNDLIALAPYFQEVLPNAWFVSPNAPFPFDMASFGYQWFSLQDTNSEALLAGARTAAPILDAFIDGKLKELDLTEDQAVLVGFSQGCMMSLHVGLRRERALAGILGYSGMLVGAEDLKAETRSRPPVLLAHGEADDVVPVRALPAAVEGLEDAGVKVEAHVRPGLGHGLDDQSIALGQDFLGRIFGVDGT